MGSTPFESSRRSHRDKIIVAGYFVRCPLGGYAWQTLHYLLSLRELGFDPYFYEDTAFYADCFDPLTGHMHDRCEHGVDIAAHLFDRFGLGDRWAFWNAQENRYFGLRESETAALLHEARCVISLAAVNRLP